jgi:surface protein
VYGWTVTDGGTDTTGPVITLVGDSTITLFVGDGYEELGASAFDALDGAVDVVVSGTVDTEAEGRYTLTYSASDNDGNMASVTRIINVVVFIDTVAPAITINGDSTIILLLEDSYQELGVSAFDEVDGAVDVMVSGEVDASASGAYTLTYSATDSAGNTASVTRTVNVGRSFITTWQTNLRGVSARRQIRIGTQGGGYDYRIDWGDGHVDENVAGDITHTYDVTGTYAVSISGDFPQLYFAGESYNEFGEPEFLSSDHAKLRSIEQWGDNQWRSMHRAFANCRNVEINAPDVPDLSGVSDMSYMFYDTSRFFSDGQGIVFNQSLSGWDVSNVTDMSYMFWGSRIFNQDLSGWDVSNVTNMSAMFKFNNVFNQDLSSWDVSNVTNMSAMFEGASVFNQSLSSWDMSNVTNMGSMFAYTEVFNQDLSSWNISNVTNIRSMFEGASAFNQDLSSWDVSNVTYMIAMFKGVTLSTENYDALLLGWSSLLLQENVTFDGGNSHYSNSSQSARDILADVYGWTITDGGVDD